MQRRNTRPLILGLRMALWLMLAPFAFTFMLYRWIGRAVGAWILATRDALPCPGCGDPISLVGRWECSVCSYIYEGFYYTRCDICNAVPPFLRCQVCGVGVRNPMIFP